MTDFNISVIVDPTGAKPGSRVVRRELGKVENVANRAKRAIAGMIGALAGGSLLIGGIRVLAQYEQQMSTVRAVTGATQKQFEALSAEAQRLGATTRFSASQAAEGLTFLARAGFSAEQAVGSLQGTLTLAQAGALDLGSAADIASNVLSSFRLNISQIGDVVDVLALTANSSNTIVQGLGESFKLVAPISAGFNVSLRETAAALGVLGDAGLQGSVAGTGLRNVLINLQNPTDAAREVLDRYKISAEDVRVSTVGLTAALSVLRDKGVTATDSLEIFGKLGGPAAINLLAMGDGLRDLNGELDNATGFAKKASDIMDDNLNGALLSVASAYESIIIKAGALDSEGGLTAFVRDVASGLRFVADNVALVLASLTSLGKIMLTGVVIKGFVALITKAKVATAGLGLFSSAATIATAATAKLNKVLLRNPIGLILTAITLVVAGMIEWAARTDEVGSKVFTTADKIKVALSFVVDGWDLIVSSTITAKAAIIGYADQLAFIPNTIKSVVNKTVGLFVGLGKAISTVIASILVNFKSIGGAGQDLLNVLGHLGKGELGAAKRAFDDLGLSATRSLSNIGDHAADAFVEGFNTDFVGSFGTVITSAINEVSNLAGPTIDKVMTEIQDRLAKTAAERQAAVAKAASAGAGLAGTIPTKPSAEVADPNAVPPEVKALLDRLKKEGEILKLSNKEREIRNALLSIEGELTTTLTPQLRAKLDTQLRENQALATKASIIDGLVGPSQELADRERVLIDLGNQNVNVQRSLIDLEIERAQLLQSNAVGFDEGFFTEINTQIAETRLNFTDFGTELAEIFGPEGSLVTGISNAAAEAIVFGRSFEDSLKKIGQQISVQILSKLIEIGVQSVLNFAISQTMGKAAVAASTGQATALATAWATPAALASLASFGSNAAPANAALAGTVAVAQGLAALSSAGSKGFANGGLIGGGGGSNRSDSQNVNLSRGEYVVNQMQTSRFLPLLEAINSGTMSNRSTGGSGGPVTYAPTIKVDGGNIDEQRLADRMQANFQEWLDEEHQVGGKMERT